LRLGSPEPSDTPGEPRTNAYQHHHTGFRWGDFLFEHTNGVEALHYTFPGVHSEQTWAKSYGPEADLGILLKELDVGLWLSEKGNWSVRMKLSSSGLYGDGRELGADLLLAIRDVNSADIRVEPLSSRRCREELSR
jgi:hypothetical protein